MEVVALFEELWEGDEQAVENLISKECVAEFPDAGRSWQGREKGVQVLLSQITMLKAQANCSCEAVVTEQKGNIVLVDEILRFNASTTVSKALYQVENGEIVRISYVNVPKTLE